MECARKIHRKMRNRDHAGFTLIELLVVIVIIGILSSMSFSAFVWWSKTREKKSAQSQIEALQLALKQYNSELGGHPRTDNSESNDEAGYARGILLFQSLTRFVDRNGEKVDADLRGNSFLPDRESFILGTREEGEIQEVTLTIEQMKGNQVPEVFILDPWGRPYVYEFPRSDGHKGFLLFSKGPDGESSVFDSELTQTPKKDEMDEDNIPPSEPGNWKR
jgi:prepilin-type N-terminal cleavage/methylation domain-containing protein